MAALNDQQIMHVLQAARDVAATISGANNRVFLNADSLLLNLVRHHQACLPIR